MKLLDMFRTPKREKVWEQSILNFISKDELKLIKKHMKQTKSSVLFEKIPISFLLSGNDLLPQIRTNKEELINLNSKLREAFFQKAEIDFSTRAFDVIPHFVASELIGHVPEKRVASAMLFSKNLKVLYIGQGQKLLDFIKEFDEIVVKEGTGISKCHVNERLACVVDDLEFVDTELFDLVFLMSEPNVSGKLVFEPSAERKANFDFFRRYVRKARFLSVNIAPELERLIDKMVVERSGSEKFGKTVRELAKSIARAELRSKLVNVDVLRAFEIADKSIKK